MSTRGFKPLRPDQMSYWQNYKKFFVSFQKSMWGDAATKDNDFAYDYLPKLDLPSYDVLRAFDMMHQGKMNGYFCQGFNPLLSFPNRKKITAALSKLKFLVVMDPLQTETARFWQNHGDFNDVDPAKIDTEVIELPATCFAEDEGSLTNSGRWLQWHWAGGTPPGEAQHDTWIMAQLYLRLKALYEKEGAPLPSRDQPAMALPGPGRPTPTRCERGQRLRRRGRRGPDDATKLVLQKGKQVVSFAVLRDDGSTPADCWIYSARTTRRATTWLAGTNKDPTTPGAFRPGDGRGRSTAASCTSASSDFNGQPWDPSRKLLWMGRGEMTGIRRAGHRAHRQAGRGRPFIMTRKAPARLFYSRHDARRSVQAHYEAVRIAGGQCPGAEGSRHPVAASSKATWSSRRRQGLPLCRDVNRLTEHFHFWTKHAQINASLQPNSSFRFRAAGEGEEHQVRRLGPGVVEARIVRRKAVVTKRIAPLICDADRSTSSYSDALALYGRGRRKASGPQFADALLLATSQYRDARIQGVWWISSPSQTPGGVRDGSHGISNSSCPTHRPNPSR